MKASATSARAWRATIKAMYDVGPEIETERLRLRMFAPEDAEEVYSIWSDPEVVKYIDPNWKPSLEQTRAAMTRLVQHWRDKGFGQWAVVHKDEAKLIGYIGFKHLDNTPEIELLYGLDKAYWDSGLTTEAARACLRYIFENTEHERITAVANPENVGSYRVMEKLGMKYERMSNNYDSELVYYAIGREEFKHGDAPYVVRKS